MVIRAKNASVERPSISRACSKSVALRLFPQENKALELLSDMAQLVVDSTSSASRMMGSPVSDHDQGFERSKP